jgi:hypothetical protein
VEKLMRQAAGLVLELEGIGEFPFIWFWPDGASGCAMMTHDVEGPEWHGVPVTSCGFWTTSSAWRSSFQVIPEGPRSPAIAMRRLVEQFKRRGFEVNVHDFNHDGDLFRRRDEFLRRADKIKRTGQESSAAAGSGRGPCTDARNGLKILTSRTTCPCPTSRTSSRRQAAVAR